MLSPILRTKPLEEEIPNLDTITVLGFISNCPAMKWRTTVKIYEDLEWYPDVVYHLKGGDEAEFQGSTFCSENFFFTTIHRFESRGAPVKEVRVTITAQLPSHLCGKMMQDERWSYLEIDKAEQHFVRGLRFIFDTEWHVVGGLANLLYKTAFRWGWV